MQCMSCRYPYSRVVETRRNENKNLIMRRRECIKCGERFTTQEAFRDPVNNYKTTPPRQVLAK
jgi:transcriptional repressor NrdR